MSRCPRCGSKEVSPVVYSASPGDRRSPHAHAPRECPAPIDRTSPNHQCMACDHSWPDQARLDTVDEIRSYFAALRAE